MLGFETRWETDEFLKRREAYLDYSGRISRGISRAFVAFRAVESRFRHVSDLLSAPDRESGLLPVLYDQIFIPLAVAAELGHPEAPLS